MTILIKSETETVITMAIDAKVEVIILVFKTKSNKCTLQFFFAQYLMSFSDLKNQYNFIVSSFSVRLQNYMHIK